MGCYARSFHFFVLAAKLRKHFHGLILTINGPIRLRLVFREGDNSRHAGDTAFSSKQQPAI